MAVTLIDFGSFEGGRIFGWELVSGETGLPAVVVAWPDVTVQLYGTFGSGTIELQGSCHAGPGPTLADASTVTYFALRDLLGNAITAKAAAYGEAIQQHPRLIRPVATTVTAVSVRLVCTAARSRTA